MKNIIEISLLFLSFFSFSVYSHEISDVTVKSYTDSISAWASYSETSRDIFVRKNLSSGLYSVQEHRWVNDPNLTLPVYSCPLDEANLDEQQIIEKLGSVIGTMFLEKIKEEEGNLNSSPLGDGECHRNGIVGDA